MRLFLLFLVHFNSHAHVERDRRSDNHQNGEQISTHTLTWSVTVLNFAFDLHTHISTHTLTWSVTKFSSAIISPP